MRSILKLIAVLLFLLATSPARAQSCRPFDERAASLLDWSRDMAVGTNADFVQSRLRLGLAPAAATAVKYVTDSRVCNKAVAAYSSRLQLSSTGRSVYVVQVGTMFLVKDPTVRPDEFSRGVVLDSKFRVVSDFSS